ncbi:MAG: ergothioneine biosynthesis protein EgtB [Proteobacteria bacterium]|nr:ergothioneine biosynthesis protein EgtB [Pseudomonadota bacterium]
MTPSPSLAAAQSQGTNTLAQRYQRVRDATLAWCMDLQPEDTVVQSMPDASPVKWHLAHTTWFFEQFLLGRWQGYRPLHPPWNYLFNSYYQSVGPMHARPQRGLLTRPTLGEVIDYRRHVDQCMRDLLERAGADPELTPLLELGLNHEQQHQELLLTDVKHLFSLNPLKPVFRGRAPMAQEGRTVPLRFLHGREGIVQIGHAGEGFAFDNESPRHRTLLHAHAMANRCVTNAEYRAFVEDGGYRTATLWLSEGWDVVQREQWSGPLYWNEDLQGEFTLAGEREIDAHAPVCHVGFYEADAFARWSGARLPTEAEWESAAQDRAVAGHFADSGALHPLPAHGDPDAPAQLFGDVWEWTSSPYIAYPGYKPEAGALGEYNGKFMCGTWVLRGGSCATPAGHVRATYRNFFHPAARWQFSGIRLGKDA